MSKETKAVQFRIDGIKTEQYAVFENLFNDKNSVQFRINLGFKVDTNNRFVGCVSTIEFVQLENVFLKLQVSCHFKIDPNGWKTFEQEDDMKLVVPRGFATHLALITIGTVRGILYSKTEGTQFSRFILPTVNVQEMIETDMVFILPDSAESIDKEANGGD